MMIKETQTVDCFRCLKCGHTELFESSMIVHIKKHKQSTCKHENRWYTIHGEDDLTIESTCRDCLLMVTTDLYSFDQTALAKLFVMLGGEQKFKKKSDELREIETTWEQAKINFKIQYGRDMTEAEIQVFQPKS